MMANACQPSELQLRPHWSFRPGKAERSSSVRNIAEKLRDLRVNSQEEVGKLKEPAQSPNQTSSEKNSTGSMLSESTCGFSSSSSCPVGSVAPLPRVSWARLQKGRCLGEGAYASTFKGILAMEDGSAVDVAIKIMHVGDGEHIHEASILEALEGAGGVPRLFGVTEEDPEAIVMEFCPGQVLGTFLKTRPLLDCVKALLASFKALEQFHEAGYAHRDLHGENIIVHTDRYQEMSVRILDVGLAVRLSEDDDDLSKIRTEGDFLDLYSIAQNLFELLDEDDDDTYTEFRQILKRIREEYVFDET